MMAADKRQQIIAAIVSLLEGDGEVALVQIKFKRGCKCHFRLPAQEKLNSDSLQSILSVATKNPQTAKVLARLSGRSYGGTFRGQLADLVRAGELVKTPDGYCLP